MTEEEKEQAILGYLTSDSNALQSYRSLTTIFEQFSRSKEWRSSFFDEVDGLDDDKEALRARLDQMVLDGLLESRMGERDYESSYRASDQGIYEASGFDQLAVEPPSNAILTEGGEPLMTEDGDFIVTEAAEESPDEGSDETAVIVDSSAWTGLTKVIIDARNAKVVSGLIDKALITLSDSQAGNFEIMQATAYLKAAKELVDAPEPPSEEIWRLISRAADLVGLLAVFFAIFVQAKS